LAALSTRGSLDLLSGVRVVAKHSDDDACGLLWLSDYAVSRLISGERELPHTVLLQRAAQGAQGLRALGVGKGHAVALILRNDFAFFEASLAAGMIGAYATPINWHFTAEEAGHIIRDSGARAVLVHSDLWPRVAQGVPAGVQVFLVPTPPEIRAAYGLPESTTALASPGVRVWDSWVASQPPLAAIAPVSPGSMIYTSGTTGRPKGVRRAPPTPEQQAASMALVAKTFGLSPDEGTVVLMNGPMYHSAPNAYGILSARIGATIVLQSRFDAEEMLALIERHRITHAHMVPIMFVRLLKLPAAVKAKYDLSSLRFIVHGAAPCPPQVKRAMIDWWGPIINEYYGATETGIPVWHDSHEALRKPGTVGRVLDGAIVKIFDEAGHELPPGSVGEIYMRARGITDFTYHGQDDKRREVGRGELVTVGDVGWVDEEGYVFLCDRKRDMVISGGVNIYPAEIEVVLITMPGVHDCAVFGIPDEEFGESLCAYLELEPGAVVEPASVRSFLAPKIAKYKIPKVINIATNLPREDSGKIFKRKLRAPYWERVGRAI
jgi:long-chain acyl-CoA synthetase